MRPASLRARGSDPPRRRRRAGRASARGPTFAERARAEGPAGVAVELELVLRDALALEETGRRAGLAAVAGGGGGGGGGDAVAALGRGRLAQRSRRGARSPSTRAASGRPRAAAPRSSNSQKRRSSAAARAELGRLGLDDRVAPASTSAAAISSSRSRFGARRAAAAPRKRNWWERR